MYNKEVTYKLNDAVTEGGAFFISRLNQISATIRRLTKACIGSAVSGVNPLGEYNAETVYKLMDEVVAANGNAYVCLLNGTVGVEPAADVLAKGGHWILFAEGGKGYVFTEGAPSASWNIKHNLGKHPSVTVIDTANDEVQGITEYISINELTIVFSAPVTGTAYLN